MPCLVCAGETKVLEGGVGEVWGVAGLGDDRHVISGTAQGGINLWDLASEDHQVGLTTFDNV